MLRRTFRGVRRLFARFARQSGPDRLLLIEALLCQVVALAAVRALPLRVWASRLGEFNRESPEEEDADVHAVADRIAWAVDRTGRLVPWHATCLMLAVTAMLLLKRRSIPYTLYLGVVTAQRAGENMEAHAWLRCGKDVLTGASEMDRFRPVTTLGYGTP